LKLERHDELCLSSQAITPWSVPHLGPYSRKKLAQDGAGRSKMTKVIFEIRSYFRNRWDYLSARR
jgi:hypothetical protein